MAFRVLSGLAIVSALLGTVLFMLHAFSYLVPLAMALVFAVGAVAARAVEVRGRA